MTDPITISPAVPRQNSDLQQTLDFLLAFATIDLMLHALLSFISILVSVFKLRRDLALENLALRQQLAVYRRRHPLTTRTTLYSRRIFRAL
jgi:hypothetical protein